MKSVWEGMLDLVAEHVGDGHCNALVEIEVQDDQIAARLPIIFLITTPAAMQMVPEKLRSETNITRQTKPENICQGRRPPLERAICTRQRGAISAA